MSESRPGQEKACAHHLMQGPAMLFNLCNCATPLVSSGGPLCIGGAGFVTAVMATLAANARTPEAKRLRENVPRVDRLAARIVTDNLTQLFVPEETLDGLTIERRVPFSYPDRLPRHILNARVGVSSFAEENNA
jgi:7,8-dihydropterin-6-yl-methyl-4-(beta-D-ribofuranosyl)aminobenzene 5'-phosphate synthase